MSSSENSIGVKLHTPVKAEAKEEEIGKKKKGHKFWHMRRHKRKTQSLPTGEHLQPIESQDSSGASELDDSDYKELDQDEQKSRGYERDEEEDSVRQKNERYFVVVTLLSGHNLAIRDRSGTSDPYVKFRHNKFKYRSPVISRSLNPVWNKKFGFVADELKTPVLVRVFDYDFGSSDDFMGRGLIDLSQHALNQSHKVKISLSDPEAVENDLGYILVQLEVSTQSHHEEANHVKESYQSLRHANHQFWKSTVTITLLGAKGLPAMDANGLCDPYCKFKLGRQKYKSKVQHKTLDPEWKEVFQMKLYDDTSHELHIELWDRDFPACDDYIGHNVLDLSQLNSEQTHELSLGLQEAPGTLQLLVVKSGVKSMEANGNLYLWESAMPRYRWWKTVDHKLRKDVGILEVQVLKADSLSKKGNAGSTQQLNPFVSLEVGNCCLRTQTLFHTQNPVWDRTFYFNIKDVHDYLSVTIFNVGRNKEDFLGRVMVPLLRVCNGEPQQYVLKDVACLQKAHGSVTLKCQLVYNTLRAAIATVNRREKPVLEEEVHVNRKIIVRNIKRCSKLVELVFTVIQFIQSLFSWNDKARSAVFLLVFTLACYFMELWMFCLLPPLCLLFFYFSNQVWRPRTGDVMVSMNSEDGDTVSDFSDPDELIESSAQPARSSSLRKKFRQMQDILLAIQTITGYVADMSERIKNFFQWSVPFLCWMAIFVCIIASFILWLVELRYLILFYGWFKSMKGLLRPHHISTNELLEFFSRSPTDAEMLKYRELSSFQHYALAKKRKHKKK